MNASSSPRFARRISRRRHRPSLALIVGMVVALSSSAVGLAADPSSPTSDAAAHDSRVAAAVDLALSDATPSTVPAASPADKTGTPGAGSSPAPAPIGRSPGSSASPSLPAEHQPPRPTPTPVPTPTPSPTPVPTPTPNITPPPRPATVDAAVPSSVLASLGSVVHDYATPYYDGCHVSMGGSMPAKSCLYGNLASHTTIAIYGDSHALAWFPAILRLVNDRGWRLLQVTMSACVPADIIPYQPAIGVMTACIAFRKAAIAKLTKYHPTVIIVTGTRGFQTIDSAGHVLTGAARTSAWVAGMSRTLSKLIPITSRVVMIADTPNSQFTAPTACIAAHPSHSLACATPVSAAVNYEWLNTEFHVALSKGVAFIDPERWVCPTDPCPLVRGEYVVYLNAGHITARFAATMYRKAELAIDKVLAQRGVIIGP
jgi:hypothetical protein